MILNVYENKDKIRMLMGRFSQLKKKVDSKMKRAILAPSLNVKLSDEHQLYSTMEDCVGKS